MIINETDNSGRVVMETRRKGNDLIDMIFGTDLIMSHPRFGVKTIQVKANEKAYDQDYKYVDWIIIATPFTIYDNKTKEKIQL